MCFPGKRLKNIFSDDDKKPASTKKPSSSPPAPATTPAPASTMSSPKVAIVIYSMYGHIAKSAFINASNAFMLLLNPPF